MSNDLKHSNEHGGLMAKSIGEIYPLAVSSVEVPRNGQLQSVWYVWNTLTGKAYEYGWVGAAGAHHYAEAVKERGLESSEHSIRGLIARDLFKVN